MVNTLCFWGQKSSIIPSWGFDKQVVEIFLPSKPSVPRSLFHTFQFRISLKFFFRISQISLSFFNVLPDFLTAKYLKQFSAFNFTGRKYCADIFLFSQISQMLYPPEEVIVSKEILFSQISAGFVSTQRNYCVFFSFLNFLRILCPPGEIIVSPST